MRDFLNEDKVVTGVFLPMKILFTLLLPLYIVIYYFNLFANSYYAGKLFVGFFVILIGLFLSFFAKCVIHEKGIDLLLAGSLIDHFEWKEVKVVLANENVIQLINIRRKKWTGLSLLFYMQPPVGTKAEIKAKKKAKFYEIRFERFLFNGFSSVGLKNDCKGLYISSLEPNFKHAILVIQKYGRYNLSPNERKNFDEELEKRLFTPDSPIPKMLSLFLFWIMIAGIGFLTYHIFRIKI
ncbi:MAG: hypothetical protein LBB56_06760 [Chitinispirillales bacterium]|nr:hypothetical protein [Chitinispirillales bacterium]